MVGDVELEVERVADGAGTCSWGEATHTQTHAHARPGCEWGARAEAPFLFAAGIQVIARLLPAHPLHLGRRVGWDAECR